MCNPSLDINAISVDLTKTWGVTAINQMKQLHAHGVCLDVALKMVVSAALSAACSAQATADATTGLDFQTEFLKQRLNEILGMTPKVYVRADDGAAVPITVN